MERIVLHSDLNSFYASCEVAANPALRGRPVAVCGSVENRHGILLAASTEAKKRGVKTGMAVFQVKQLCPDITILPPRMDMYINNSRTVKRIYSDYTDRQESMGIDEAFLDVTGCECSQKSGALAADEIRRRVLRETGLTVSVGVSWNKIFAKLGSDYKKPNAVTSITKDNYKSIVWPLPADDLLMVGRATKYKLGRMGISTIGQIAECEPEYLKARFGKVGLMLHRYANGWENSPVHHENEEIPEKSIGNSTTTKRNLENDADAWITLMMLAESVGARLRDAGYMGTVIEMSYRTPELFWRSHQRKLKRPTDITREILEVSFALFKEARTLPLRSIGVRVTGLVSAQYPQQLDMFDDIKRRDKLRAIDKTVDELRSRYGFFSVQRGVALTDPDLGRLNAKGDHTVHPIGFAGG